MTDEEFIAQAKNDWPDENISDVLTACEAHYLNGFYDDISGHVEAPTGHFYMIERWIVLTDSQGFKRLHTYDSVQDSEKAFNELEQQYAEWDNEGE